MGEAARRRVEGAFSPDRHFGRLTGILHELWQQAAPDVDHLAPDPTATAAKRLSLAAAQLGRPVGVYGAGMFGRKVLDACLDRGIQVCAWVDSDPARAGTNYRGVVCQSPATLVEQPETVFLVASLQFAGEISERIRDEFAKGGVVAPRILMP
jgi:hypothetical protein